MLGLRIDDPVFRHACPGGVRALGLVVTIRGVRADNLHDQVRAWHLTFGMSGLRAPVAELDGEQVVPLQTRLADPGGEARRVECGDGPIWVVASEPV